MSYSSYDHDDLEPASTMRIERRIYFESGKADLSEMVKLPLAELLSLRAESAAAEQEVFDRLKEQATAWEEQAGRTLFLDKALEYARTLPVTHTANQWEAPDEYRHIRSNMVYQMDYSISENTRYDSAAPKSVPYSWTLRWSLRTNAPGSYQQAKIAGQDRKVFSSREELDKYLNGRIKAHEHYFTEISPAIPKEYADYFKVNGCLLPGYTIEGEEPAKAAELPAQEETAQPQQTAATPERREPVNEVFSIFLDNRAEAQTGGPHGYWLSLPTSAEQVQEALKEIHITADNQQDLFIGGGKTAGTAGGFNQGRQRGRTELPCRPASKAGRRGACGAERRHAVPGKNADHRAAFGLRRKHRLFCLNQRQGQPQSGGILSE